VGQHENGRVIGRVVAPPALPAVVAPRIANRAEHVPAQDPRAEIFEPAGNEVVVDAGGAAVTAEEFLDRPRRERPLVQGDAPDAERVLETLVRARAEAVDGNRKAVYAKPGHRFLLCGCAAVSVRPEPIVA
jgi:hypothetical protein